jgi:hypothetical protein
MIIANVGNNLANPMMEWFCPACAILIVAIPVLRVIAWWLGRKPTRRPKRRVR